MAPATQQEARASDGRVVPVPDGPAAKPVRTAAFDAARGAALFMVVVLHTTLLPISDVDGTQRICRMALLLLISGALSRSLPGNPGRARSRSGNLAWLALVWTAIALLVTDGLAGLSRLPGELVAPTSHLWYIELLAMMTLLMPLLRRVPPAVPLTVTAAAALAHTLGLRTGIPGWDQALHFAVFFYVGLYLRPVIDEFLRSTDRAAGVALLATGVLLFLLPVPHYVVTLGSVVVLLGACHAFRDALPVRGLAWFGRRTAEVYLPHVAVLCAMVPLLTAMVGRLDWPLVLAVAAVTTAACLGFRALADMVGLGLLYAVPDWSATRNRTSRALGLPAASKPDADMLARRA